jgi:hypothetical protein
VDHHQVNDDAQRQALFITHANPEDNEFTIWLGSHLSCVGYEVWADVFKLRGGQDWARKLEDALRERACKVLLVGTPSSAKKQGVRNEIQIACDVARKINDNEFVIPLRLQPFEAPFQIVHAQYIDFIQGWGQGLTKLLETLVAYKVPRMQSFHTHGIENWRAVQLNRARLLDRKPEPLVSNWVRIVEWPNSIRHYEFRAGVTEDNVRALVNNCRWPVFPFNRGFWTFGDKSDFHTDQGESFPILSRTEFFLPHFLENGSRNDSVHAHEARNIVSHLTKCALEKKLHDSNLSSYEYSNGVVGWWVHSKLITGDKVSFKWEGGPSGRRQLVGEVASGQTKLRWHFGVSGKPWIGRDSYIKFLPRILFTEDGLRPIEDVKRTHRLRRSVPKSWRNARWRDMLLSFLYWFSKGGNHVSLEAGSLSSLKIEVPPITMISPVSVIHDEDREPEETEIGDPVFEGEFDEAFEDGDGEENSTSHGDEEPSSEKED